MASSSSEAERWTHRVQRVSQELCGARLPPQDCDRVVRYLQLLGQWNQKIDLTAARDDDEFVDLAVADALVIGRWEPLRGASAVDIGSGAGAPGIVLAIVRPDLRLCLVEPMAKRVAFLRSVAGTLGLDNVTVRRGRSADVAAASAEIAVSRATFAPGAWLAEADRLATGAAWVLLAQEAAPSLPSWGIPERRAYPWPLTGRLRAAARYKRLT